MATAPSIRTQKNIKKFAAMWVAGDMVACKESYTAARRYLDAFGHESKDQGHAKTGGKGGNQGNVVIHAGVLRWTARGGRQG